VLEVSPRTVQRWQCHQNEPDQRKSAAQQRLPENKLSEKERDHEIHRHSALKFVTPGQLHRGEDVDLLKKRAALYNSAKDSHPARWSGATRNWEHEQVVYLNPTKSD